jgi:two-component sensor histidine kinase
MEEWAHRTAGGKASAPPRPAPDGRTDAERRSEEALRIAGIGLWEWNPQSDEAWWSPVAYQLWGLPVAAAPPPASRLPLHPEDRIAYEQALAQARDQGVFNLEWRVVRPDGSVVWLAAVGRLEEGGGPRILGVVQDVSGAKHTEARLRPLLGELQHRVRNILNVVRSVVSMTVRNADNVEALASHLDGRLDVLARTQRIFIHSGGDALDLEDMVRDEMLAAAAGEHQMVIEGPPLRLRRAAAETVALALHELATNAVKFGALAYAEGTVTVRWRIDCPAAGPLLTLEWRESGVPVIDLAPKRSGFGRELIERGLPYELGARTALVFARGGIRALIEMPLTDKVAILAPCAERRSDHGAD